jgi:hypothetical protein
VSGETRFPAKVGFDLAILLMGWLADVVERIEVAGSLRRDKQDLGDVELVMIPKFKEELNIFSEPVGKINLLNQRCDELLSMRLVEKRLNKNDHAIAWGGDGRYKALLVGGIPVDLFIVLPDRQFGPTMLIRTGPGNANQVLVTTDGVKNAEGNLGILPKGMVWEDGALWQDGSRINTPEEIDVFKAVGLPYIPPHERSLGNYHLWAKVRARGEAIAGRNVKQYGYWEIKWRVGEEQIALHNAQALKGCSEEAVQSALGIVQPDEGLLEYTGAAYEPPLYKLDVAEGLDISAEDFVGVHAAVLGMSGMGKSNLIARLCEEISRYAQMTIVDLEGEYRSLKSQHPFLVVGKSEEDDRQVNVTHASGLVDEIMESGKSIILDMYDFDTDDRNEFLRLYFDRLFEVEGKKRKPHVLVMEEASEFLNQQKKSPVTEVAIRLAKRGRKRGVGIIMVSQRPASLDKDVLNMSRILFLLGVQFPQDIRAYNGMLPKDFDAEGVSKKLRIGEVIVRRAGSDGIPVVSVFKIRKRRSVDLGATPKLQKQLTPEMA